MKTEAVTDVDGRFRLPYLRVGPYEITVHRDGFADDQRSLTLSLASAFDLSISLAVAGVDTRRHRHWRGARAGDGPQPDCRHAAAGGGAEPAAERPQLPRSRAARFPASRRRTSGAPSCSPETSAVPGQGISVASQRNLSNSFIVDGLSANDDAAGLSGIPYGVDAVEQFQVVTSGGQAELGRALGGYVSVVTRSGTNRMHGTLYDFIRDDRFNAANALSGTTLPMDQQQYGGSLGGPVVREPDVLLRERRAAACSISRGSSPSFRRTWRSSTRS